MQPFRSQRRALQHAEPVLFVDDHETELVKTHVALHQRVRAHDQVHCARLNCGELFPSRGARGGAGQQRDAEARRLQEPRDVREVLLGQNLGRRHERHLQTVLHRDDRRQQRHDGLPRPDVALQEPIHRVRPLHVLDDLLQGLPLPGGEAERQHAARGLADAIVHLHDHRLALGRRGLPPREHAHLKQERFFEDEPLLRGVAN